MKEYIFQINNNPAGNDIVVDNAPAGLLVKNILAIINKTTGKPVHSPIAQVIDSVTYSGTTMTITLDSNAPSIEGNLLIKAYSDEAAGSYDEMIANWLGITEATEYTALTPAEAIAIARDCQYNVMGTDWPIPTWLPTGVTEAQVESAAEGLGIPYHEPTQTA